MRRPDLRLRAGPDQDSPDYRALQPFGQVPTLEEDGLALSGERSETLLPKDARACATRWLIAALNSVEPFVRNVAVIASWWPITRGRVAESSHGERELMWLTVPPWGCTSRSS